MKKANKIISVVLAVVLAFSALPLLGSAAAIKPEIQSLDALTKTNNLAELIGWLLTSINNRKDKITGTILRFVVFGVKDFKAAVGDKDPLKLSDEEAAKVLVDYLNKMLKEETSSITGQKWWPLVKGIGSVLGLTVKIDSVDGVLKTAYSICKAVNKKLVMCGDLEGLKGDALKDVSVGKSGNLGVIKALLQWLADNTPVIKRVLTKGDKLDFGLTLEPVIKGADVGKQIQQALSQEAINKKLYEGIKLSDAGYEESGYKGFTGDQLLAAKFVQLLEGDGKAVTKEQANEVLGLTIYDFFAKYANQAYAKFLVPLLNKQEVRDFFTKINVDGTFKDDYEFTDGTFSEIFETGKEKGFVEQLNNVVCTILDTILTKKAADELGLEKGDNEKLDGNLTKTLRYILPLINKYGADLGFDFSRFTEENVKNMETEQMIVAVLKIFYPGWFHIKDDAVKKAWIDNADSLEKLLVLAAYLTIDYDKWTPYMKADGFKDKIFDGENFKALPGGRFIYIAFDMFTELGARALAAKPEDTRFALPEDTKDWGAENYIGAIVDWALKMVKGLPKVADELEGESYGGFYKLNVLLNELLDMSFISGCKSGTFSFDIRHMFLDVFLPNLCNFNLKDAVQILAENENAAVFNKKLVPAVIDTLNRLLTAIFEYKPNAVEKNVEVQKDCTTMYSISKYDRINGLYITVNEKEIPKAQQHHFEDGICTHCGKSEPKDCYFMGDVNMDGGITAADARLVLRAAVKLENYEKGTDEYILADVTKDDLITAADARLVLRAAVNLEEKVLSPIEKIAA